MSDGQQNERHQPSSIGPRINAPILYVTSYGVKCIAGKLVASYSHSRMQVLDMSAINGAVSSITVAQAISTQLEDNKQASARTVIFAQIVATDLMSGEAMVMAEFRNVTLWCGPSWSLAKPTAIQALEAAEKKLDDIPSLGLAFNPMTVECTEDCPRDDDEGQAEQLRNFVIGTFVLVCVGVHPLSSLVLNV